MRLRVVLLLLRKYILIASVHYTYDTVYVLILTVLVESEAFQRSYSGMNSPPHNMSSIPYPLMLSPAPTPISSPTIFTPSSAGSRVNFDKWREIAKKLSYHNELRAIWNQLKIRGGFVTNEHFISHLLRHESIRQSVQYDILSLKEPINGSEVTQLDDLESVNEVNPTILAHPVQQSDNDLSTHSKFSDIGPEVEEDKMSPLRNHESSNESCSPPISPEAQKVDGETCTPTANQTNRQEVIELYGQPDSSKQQIVVTVLDSQMQCTPDEPGSQLL